MIRPSRLIRQWRAISADGEQQMVINRMLVGVFSLSFNYWAIPRGLMSWTSMIAPCVYILIGWMVGAHLLVHRTASFNRRLFALFLDCVFGAFELHAGGGATAWQFAGFLWVIFGNGFRFGSRFQVYSMLVATLCFTVMVVFTPYWYMQPAQLFGAAMSLTVVPLYALALIKKLSHAIQLAEEANRAKSLFLASVSHELRTPLNAVIGMGALLQSSDLKPEQRQMSQTIMTAARSLLSLIDAVLDLSRVEAGRMIIARSDFELSRLLNEVKSIFIAQGRIKGIDLNVHITSRTPLVLHGDARKLHEILLNLLGNAIKFTESGSITVAVDIVALKDSQARLRFEVTDTGIGIAPAAIERIFEVFTQADETIVNRFGGTGLGLALVRKTVELLGGEIGVNSVPGSGSTFWFELPIQVQEAAAGEVARLSNLVVYVQAGPQKNIVAPLLGRLVSAGLRIENIDVAPQNWPVARGPSTVCLLAFTSSNADPSTWQSGGLGSDTVAFVSARAGAAEGLPDVADQRAYTSILYLPASDAELGNVLSLVSTVCGNGVEALEKTPVPAAQEHFNVLVADDNATNRFVLDTILRSAGHTVTLVNNGEQALEALDEEEFDVAVFDVNMPVLGGIEAVKHYRMSVPGTDPIPVIAFTADATAETRERCLDAGMAACLVKPVEPVHLISLLNEVVAASRSGQPKQPAAADPRVTAIAAHPRFRGNAVPALDAEVLARLRALGGEAFVVEVTDLFRDEARSALLQLRAAVRNGDVASFRANAHALRSVGANVGARPLGEICLPLQTISAVGLEQGSKLFLEQIEAELNRVEMSLAEYRSDRDIQAGR
jgi:two-component system sensor histidine kinase RpfC